MYPLDLQVRQLMAAERVEALRRDAQPRPQRRRRPPVVPVLRPLEAARARHSPA